MCLYMEIKSGVEVWCCALLLRYVLCFFLCFTLVCCRCGAGLRGQHDVQQNPGPLPEEAWQWRGPRHRASPELGQAVPGSLLLLLLFFFFFFFLCLLVFCLFVCMFWGGLSHFFVLFVLEVCAYATYVQYVRRFCFPFMFRILKNVSNTSAGSFRPILDWSMLSFASRVAHQGIRARL